MRVECLITSEGKERYMLVDNKGGSVAAVLRYIKYKDNTGSARNTLREHKNKKSEITILSLSQIFYKPSIIFYYIGCFFLSTRKWG